jgi:hypothetical protein
MIKLTRQNVSSQCLITCDNRLSMFSLNKLNSTTHQYDSPTERRGMPECMFNQILYHSL